LFAQQQFGFLGTEYISIKINMKSKHSGTKKPQTVDKDVLDIKKVVFTVKIAKILCSK